MNDRIYTAARRILVLHGSHREAEPLPDVVRTVLPGAEVTAARPEEGTTLLRQHRYDVVIHDFAAAGRDRLGTFMALMEEAALTPVLVIADRSDPVVIGAVLALHAAGLVNRAELPTALSGALERIYGGDHGFEATDVALVPVEHRLTWGQLRVLLALGEGRLNKQIADDLGVSEATIKAHLSAIFRKLGVLNRTQALIAAGALFGR